MSDSQQDRPRIEVKNFDHLSEKWLSEKQFTDRARLMLDHVRRRALNRGIFGVLPPLLVLWAMLRWERMLALEVLVRCGVNLRTLEDDVAVELNAVETEDWRRGIDGSRICHVVDLACEEAALLGHSYVGSEHLVLALCRLDDEATMRVFAKHGIVADRYKQVLLPLLRGEW